MEKGPWTEWNPSILKCWKLNKTIHHHVASLISCMNWYSDFLMWAHFSCKLGLITHFFANVLIINLVKYNEEINMTVKFLMNMFKQSCVIMFLNFSKKFWVFWKNLYKYHFWLGGLLEEKIFLPSSVSCQWRGIFNGSFMQNFNQIGQLFQKLCRFFNFFSGRLVGLSGLLGIL